MKVEVKVDKSDYVIDRVHHEVLSALEECGQVAEGYAKIECPVRTGRLRRSITHTTTSQLSDPNHYDVVIGTNVEYAPYVEYGARGREPRHFLKHAAENHADEYVAIIRRHLDL